MTGSGKRNVRFCVVIPMYNESGNVLPTVESINFVLNSNKLNADILCVDDGSVDATGRELDEASSRWANVTVKTHKSNRGFGAARWTGMKTVIGKRYVYVLFMDADLTMDPKYILEFHKTMLKGYDFVTGTRFMSGGGMLKVPLYRRAISMVGNVILRICFRLKLSDYSQGFRAIRMNVVEQFHLNETGFPILVEELYQAKCLTKKFAEVPFVLTTRQRGVSKFSYTPRVIFKYLFYAAKAFAVHS